MSRSGTPMQRLREKQRASPPPERVAYLRERGLEIAVEDAQETADAAVVDAGEAQATADTAVTKADDAQTDADAAQLTIDETLDGTRSFSGLNVEGQRVEDFLARTDGDVLDDPAAVPQSVIEAQVRGAVGAGSGLSFNTGTGVFSLNLTSGHVTAALGFSPLDAAQKGAANGVAPLDAGSKIPTAYLPALAITSTAVVASQAAQLALTAQEGDVAVRSDLNKSYIHNGGGAGTMADWQELLTPTDAVLSVNGFTGAITLTTAHITEGSNLYWTNARGDARIAAAVGVTVEAKAANLTAIGALTSAADKLAYATGAGTWALTTLTSYARTLLDDTSASDARTTLGLGTGALKDYTAGTYTPTWGGGTLTVGLADYIRIGDLCFVMLDVTFGASASSAIATLSTPFDLATAWGAGSINFCNYGPSVTVNLDTGSGASTPISFRSAMNVGGRLLDSDVAGKRFIFNIMYRAV